jgi:hypothetical protein
MMEGVEIFYFSGIVFPGHQEVDVVAGGITWNELKGLLFLDLCGCSLLSGRIK